MIDLDQPAGPPAPRLRRWPTAPRAVALVLVGAAVGGGAVYRWQHQRDDDRRRSAVSLVIIPDPLGRPDDSVTAKTVVNRRTVEVDLVDHVEVVNAGPAPVRFAGLRAESDGARLRGEPWSASTAFIPAGGSTVGRIQATVRCGPDPLVEPIPVVVDVVTADGVRRQSSVDLDGRAWSDPVKQTCAHAVEG